MLHVKEIRHISVTLFIFFINSIDSYPIEVTGKDISYYKLTPNEGSGSYNFDYGTHDGAQRSERGFVKHEPGHAEPLLVVTGSFKHPDGKEVFYIADEQGYRIVAKEDIDDLHSKLPNEIIPTKKPATSKPISSKPISANPTSKPNSKPISSKSISSKPISSKSISSKPISSELISSSVGSKPVASALKTLSTIRPDNSISSSSRISSSLTIQEISERTLKNTEATSQPKYEIPVTESQLIKVNIIQPISIKPVTCAPGKCSGDRQSKIFKIKPIKFG